MGAKNKHQVEEMSPVLDRNSNGDAIQEEMNKMVSTSADFNQSKYNKITFAGAGNKYDWKAVDNKSISDNNEPPQEKSVQSLLRMNCKLKEKRYGSTT